MAASHCAVPLTLALAVMVVPLMGCPRAGGSSEATRQERVPVCAKEGDRCEFAPGKIGLCTAKEGSTSLTCVSLH
jgi:hypothetical protein